MNRQSKIWLICLLIVGVYTLTTYSYGDFESIQDDNVYRITAEVSAPTNSSPIYVITSYYPSTTTVPPPLPVCNNNTLISLPNGTCVSRQSALIIAINTLYSNTSNDTDKANALSLYISAITNSNISSNSNYTLTIDQMDGILENLTIPSYTVNNTDSFIMITQPNGYLNSKTLIGASFEPDSGGTVVNTLNRDNVTNGNLSAAGIITLESLNNVKSFNMFIVYNSTPYANIDNTSNRTLASSMVYATINTESTDHTAITIDLYFQDLNPPKSNENVEYLCTFYDKSISQWNEAGCTLPLYNVTFNRYECSCNHLTSFALIWLPISSLSSLNNTSVELDAQDKASIAFQVISIVCFLAIVIHAIIIRIIHPQKYTQPRNLLPLISCGITMILFIFYIALGLTVYTRFSGSNINNTMINNKDLQIQSNNQCLSNELGLMFIVYFLIITMFCSKTSVGYYNYVYFVKLFPPPSLRNLLIALVISCIIGLIWMIFAIGFNSNSSYEIIQIYLGKICWFSHNVIHYFLTIPICIFLLINLILFILVAKHIISHAQHAETDRSKYNRRRNCVIVLLSSCVTQGLGWLFGPLISIASPQAANVLGWLFVIFNGLEGFWAILLYIIIRRERMDTNIRDPDNRNKQLLYLKDINPQIPMDNIKRDQKAEPLNYLASNSPHHSFTDLADVEIIYRSNDDDENDNQKNVN